MYSKTCVKRPLPKRPKIGFQDQLQLNAGQKYCRMLQGEHSAILFTLIKLQFVIKLFVLSIFEWMFYTGFTVLLNTDLINVTYYHCFFTAVILSGQYALHFLNNVDDAELT